MQNFITVLKAEHIKKKGTGIYIMAIIISAFAPFINLLSKITFDAIPHRDGVPFNYYMHTIEESLEAFAVFFYPLLIIIMVSRISQLDHKYGGWQLMETQPIKKSSIYFSKFTVIIIGNLIAIFSMIITGYIAGLIAGAIKGIPEYATASFDFLLIADIILRLFIAGLLFSALQYMLSVLMPSFIWSILIGFGILISYIFVQAFDVTIPDWHPIEILNKIAIYKDGSDLGYPLTYSEFAGFILSLLVLFLGFKWYSHKTLTTAFLANKKRIVTTLVTIVVLGGISWYILIPKVDKAYERTVISGKIETDKKIDTAYLTDNFIGDTIAVIPLHNNEFSYTIKKNIPLDRYLLRFDGKGLKFIFGNRDSVYLDLKVYNAGHEVKVTGTRTAENSEDQKQNMRWNSINYDLEHNEGLDKPGYIISEIVKEWKESTKETNNFKNVDNYVPREDYLAYKRRLITLEYLNYWNTLVKKRTVLFPKSKTVATPEILAMIKSVPLNDEGMLSNEEYFNYIREKMISENKADLDENTKTLQAITKLKPGSFRDKMLYWQLEKSILESSSTEERNALTGLYEPLFDTKKYASLINQKKRILESLSKGNQAPSFATVTTDKKPVVLADLKGKYVAIDTWATWCGPCKVQSPYFEKLAIKYKDQNIQFVAISVDDDFKDWLVSAKEKSKSVLQLHVNDKDKFYKDYNLEGIPTFILIDPNGNMVNAKMPYPQQPAFEQAIREALNLPEQK